jgi:hypothetical protein
MVKFIKPEKIKINGSVAKTNGKIKILSVSCIIVTMESIL